MILKNIGKIDTSFAHNSVSRKALIKIGELKSKIQTVNYAWLEPGQFFDPHIHEDCEELYFFLEGKGEMLVNNKMFKIKKGDMAVIEAGEKHGLKNTKKSSLFFITIRVKL